MDHTPSPSWAKHLIRAAIDYFTERHTRACLVIDNAILKDGVVSAICREGDAEFIVCVAPGFTTQLDFGPEELSITVRFDVYTHAMVIPYYAIRYVIAANSDGILTDQGQLNLISIPPVVYSPQTMRRRRTDLEQKPGQASDDSSTIATQPTQTELQFVARRS